MSSERADQPATPDNQPPVHGVPGQVLARQREAMGWSVEQVADQLKLAVRQVIALEAGDYASLPSPAVTRGFVRAYAKLVKVDPAPLVAQIAMETEPAPDTSAVTANRRPTPTSFSQSKFPSHGKRSSLPLGMIAGAVVVVVAAAAAAWHFGFVPGGQHAETGTTVATPATPAVTGASTEAVNGSSVEALQNPAVPLISVPGPSASASAPATTAAPGAVVNVPGTTATGAPPTTVPTAPAAAPGATSPATPVPAATAPAAPAAAGANALVLNVREDSWIEVRPAKGGAPLFSRLVKAGSTETVNVEQPVRVTVGNPGGVTATLRGTAVALPPVPGKTLSRVNLQ
ncbi:helix-turn-helix domain-containing protein [Massilia cellulosiltytica]|uniref:helix-turn-helix domain-containing protein n=1 Tax=Massilia cellulosiltytica TaxID=2683234 RepID=UPI0039B4B0CD